MGAPWVRPFKPGYCDSWEWHTEPRNTNVTQLMENVKTSAPTPMEHSHSGESEMLIVFHSCGLLRPSKCLLEPTTENLYILIQPKLMQAHTLALDTTQVTLLITTRKASGSPTVSLLQVSTGLLTNLIVPSRSTALQLLEKQTMLIEHHLSGTSKHHVKNTLRHSLCNGLSKIQITTPTKGLTDHENRNLLNYLGYF